MSYGQYNGSSLYTQAAIPPMQNQAMVASGVALNNIDGRAIKGGQLSAGNSGYNLASMGAPSGNSGMQCNAFPLWVSAYGGNYYTLSGFNIQTNWKSL